ncbi:Yip1 family protein [Desulfoscipio gibsoniae]|uniref:Yip1 domain protein n=1 Tax=Desulfoscipio gibsoniae DSM 7213 TaxID=767817 RepID=R4KW63_9FIRM|nr:Yip1 family protein [Desulfoscipio gibsoniae]AGL03861.1 Yip1 domain protein [Desulfoscipio gibsoniae DSM 7213]
MDNLQNNNEHVRDKTSVPDGQMTPDNLNTHAGGPLVNDDGKENVYLVEERDNIVNNGQVKNGILDVFYGVLFEPARTFAGFVSNPPIGTVVIIFVVLNLVEALTGIFTTPIYLDRINLAGLPGVTVGQATLSFVAVTGFLFSIFKWFFMAGLLHLLAELYAGSGSARSVFTVYGAAGLPAVFMIPVQIAIGLVNAGWLFNFMAGLLAVVIYFWGVVLLIIGLREVHHFSTARAVLVAMTPGMMLVFLTLLTFVYFGTVVSSIMAARII